MKDRSFTLLVDGKPFTPPPAKSFEAKFIDQLSIVRFNAQATEREAQEIDALYGTKPIIKCPVLS